MPATFAFPIRESLWVPLRVDPLATARGQGPRYPVVGLLKRGVSAAQATAQLTAIAAQLEREFPEGNRGLGAGALPYTETLFQPEIYAMLFTMLGAGIGVLLIACVNVSNLLVARASLRRREVAVRMALGAARGRIIRQHLTEVLVLACAGAVLGILLSVVGVRWFTATLSANPPPFWITFDLDHRIMLFVLGLIVLSSLFAGGLPALQAARVDAGAALKDDNRSSTSGRLGRFSSALVVGELAVSCGLLIAAGLMIKSVVQLRTVPMPFSIENVLTARVDLPRADYPDSPASIRFFERLLPQLRAVPGVEAATLSDGLPAAGNGSIPVQIAGKAYPQASDYPLAREGIVTPGTSRRSRRWSGAAASSIPATAPRVSRSPSSTTRSRARTSPARIRLGRQFRRIRPGKNEPWLTVVGLVPDLLMEGIGNNGASPVGYYIPIAQSDVANGVRIAVRTGGDAASLTPLLRSAVDVAGPEPGDLRSQRDAPRHRSADLVLYDVRDVLHGVRHLRAAARGGRALRRHVVRRDPADTGDGRALGARRTGQPADCADHAAQHRSSRRWASVWAWFSRSSRPARCGRCCTASIPATLRCSPASW